MSHPTAEQIKTLQEVQASILRMNIALVNTSLETAALHLEILQDKAPDTEAVTAVLHHLLDNQRYAMNLPGLADHPEFTPLFERMAEQIDRTREMTE